MSSLGIRRRLQLIEDEFISVLSTDNLEATASFAQRWAQLDADVKAALHVLDNDTIALAHTIAAQVTIVADLFLSIRKDSDNITNHLETIFDGLNLDVPVVDADSFSPSESNSDHPSLPASLSPLSHASVGLGSDSSLPSYIEPAYKWLLKHLHNPYPAKKIKQQFADDTGSSVERISDWFVDVRRRMGWSELLRDDFGRRRLDLVNDAKRFFISDDPRNPLPVELVGKFTKMKTFAEEMYAAKFVPSQLSNKLTSAVKTLTPELQEKAREERFRKLQAQREASKNAHAYPSPAPSGAPSPISDPGASSSSQSFASRKRSSSDASDDDSSNKRSRTDDGPSPDFFDTGLLSPPHSDAASSPTSSSFSDGPSRKRRLSDADAHGAPKRPHNRLSGPRVQAVSAPSMPFTITLTGTPELLADWFSSDRQGSTTQLEPGELLDIHYFDPASLQFGEEPPAPSQPVLTEVTSLPQALNASTSTLTLDLTLDFDEQLAQYLQWPTESSLPQASTMSITNQSYVGSVTYEPSKGFSPPTCQIVNPGPGVYEPAPSDAYANGYDFNPGYITRENVAERFAYDAMPSEMSNPARYSAYTDGNTASEFITGIFELNSEPQDDISLWNWQTTTV
ncbi:C-terminal domain of homeodomain 1-domain-containing protein [Mycena sp. CBHHK59/15]|nr:C-terminal domain of homeodomain 1-domain-containing protein [Mycena sp. CBHHK59/15]